MRSFGLEHYSTGPISYLSPDFMNSDDSITRYNLLCTPDVVGSIPGGATKKSKKRFFSVSGFYESHLSSY